MSLCQCVGAGERVCACVSACVGAGERADL